MDITELLLGVDGRAGVRLIWSGLVLDEYGDSAPFAGERGRRAGAVGNGLALDIEQEAAAGRE